MQCTREYTSQAKESQQRVSNILRRVFDGAWWSVCRAQNLQVQKALQVSASGNISMGRAQLLHRSARGTHHVREWAFTGGKSFLSYSDMHI